MLIGYARTSTIDQHYGLDAQLDALTKSGCEKIFHEQVSSLAHREALNSAIDFSRDGDFLVVTKPARSRRPDKSQVFLRRSQLLLSRSMGQ